MINFPTISATMSALITALAAAKWTPSGGSQESAFGEVKQFELIDVAEAFRQLVVVKQRVCIVVFVGEQYQTQNSDSRHQFAPVCRLTRSVSLLISDRVIGDLSVAMYGDAATCGCYPLKDIALNAICGPLITTDPALMVEPISVSPFSISADQKSTKPGRGCVQVELECKTAWRELITADPTPPAPTP